MRVHLTTPSEAHKIGCEFDRKKQIDLPASVLYDPSVMNDQLWQAVVARDARFDGQFVFAVSSTKVYCRPSCPSRRPSRERVSFFDEPAAAEEAGYRACLRCKPQQNGVPDPQLSLVQRVCRLLDDAGEGEPLKLAELAARIGVSSFHLQRTFKRVMGISPRQYVTARRFGNFKQLVREGESVINALYDSGFNSSSRVYEQAAEELGMTPATYGRGGRGVTIDYTIAPSPLGRLLVAVTERGVCAVRMGDSDAELEKDLREEFPSATIGRDDASLQETVKKVLHYLTDNGPHLDLPLDIRATAFQRQVWEKLRTIPYGETVSYADVAKALGKPGAVRAVGRACATNPVALVIPCHRVVREDKSLGGYRWGLDRKQKLLDRERAKSLTARR
ncbi:MAG TPA: bifunctional DNA-binding transcriptional regulator/O6-methylguanine-DNA methyltransferase Ada [Pyrinomonadaceae bacterium]|nr:bifunctional DNA-binding transcriptional regulator/O6-methylguanine-DNA methyltransferase Ada [Pyrinomonadaceae bacterium]